MMSSRLGWVLAPLLIAATAAAAPYVAYVGNTSVHSASPDAKIVVVDLAGGAVVNVSEGLSSARNPAWSPDGTRVAFESVGDGLCDILVCKPDGTERANVTATPDEWESAPCFVDANRVAYLSGPDRAEVWLADLATGAKQRLSATQRFWKQPVASPDGELLAVTGAGKLAGVGDILLIATDGSGERNLTNAPAIYSRPAFTPDGKSVVFAYDGRDIGGATRGLALMPVEGGEPKLLAPQAYPLAPVSVSADGAKVAYTTADVYHSTWVSVLDLATGTSTRLEVQPFHIISWPSLSPDGKTVAFQGVYAAIYGAFVVELETGKMTRVTPQGETGVNPVFSPR